MIAATPTAQASNVAPANGARPHAFAVSARTALLLATLVAALAWNAISRGARSDADALSAPPLPVLVSRCGLASDDHAELGAYVRQLASAARARVDRYPYRPAEGLPALALLGEAAACAALAENGADVDALQADARGLRRRVELDYRDRVLRVERALSLDEAQHARADIEALAAQLDGEDHAFARRMRNLRSMLADAERK